MAARWDWSDLWAYIKGATPEMQKQMATKVDQLLQEMLPRLTQRWRVHVLSNAPEVVIESVYRRNLISTDDLEALGDIGMRVAGNADY